LAASRSQTAACSREARSRPTVAGRERLPFPGHTQAKCWTAVGKPNMANVSWACGRLLALAAFLFFIAAAPSFAHGPPAVCDAPGRLEAKAAIRDNVATIKQALDAQPGYDERVGLANRLDSLAVCTDIGPVDAASLDDLIALLSNSDGYVVMHAAHLIGEIGPAASRAEPALRLAMKRETSRPNWRDGTGIWAEPAIFYALVHVGAAKQNEDPFCAPHCDEMRPIPETPPAATAGQRPTLSLSLAAAPPCHPATGAPPKPPCVSADGRSLVLVDGRSLVAADGPTSFINFNAIHGVPSDKHADWILIQSVGSQDAISFPIWISNRPLDLQGFIFGAAVLSTRDYTAVRKFTRAMDCRDPAVSGDGVAFSVTEAVHGREKKPCLMGLAKTQAYLAHFRDLPTSAQTLALRRRTDAWYDALSGWNYTGR
jgi:hypothetical protein